MNSIPETLYLTLLDTRRLAYLDLGPAGGTPVIYFHGHPGSRLEQDLIDGLSESLEKLNSGKLACGCSWR